MCLIIDRPRGTNIPATLIEEGLANNPDGWGVMWARKGRIRVLRGLKPETFTAALAPLGDREVTIHFRWATHGTKDEGNTHPFVFGGGKYALMHNGIISNVPIRDKERSDTWHFTHDVLAPILAANPRLFGTPELEGALSKAVGGGNKLVILRADGARMIVNRDAGAEYKGLWLSNTHSLYPRPRGGFGSLSDRFSRLSEWERIEEGAETLWSLDDFAGFAIDEIEQAIVDDPEWVANLIHEHVNGYSFRH